MTVRTRRRWRQPVERALSPVLPEQGERLVVKDFAKRLVDLLGASVLLFITSPFLLVAALVIRFDSPGPALFRQTRVGRGGCLFVIFKFRTMRQGTLDLPTDEMTRQSGPSPVTPAGRLLRRTSLDELPQLFNVLKGEMSLVGPRPALPTQTELNKKRAHAGVDTLLPGITGWAQINGRDEIDTTAKVAHDAWYLAHRSLGLDLAILARTLEAALSGRGNR